MDKLPDERLKNKHSLKSSSKTSNKAKDAHIDENNSETNEYKSRSNSFKKQFLQIPKTSLRLPKSLYTTCPSSHMTHNFLSCDLSADCWRQSNRYREKATNKDLDFFKLTNQDLAVMNQQKDISEENDDRSNTFEEDDDDEKDDIQSLPFCEKYDQGLELESGSPKASFVVGTKIGPDFPCENGDGLVSYTLVCDFRNDCPDGSDESFCIYPPCESDQFTCDNYQVCII